MTILYRVVATTQEKAWMDELQIIKWIRNVWIMYVGGKPALLSHDTF